MINNKTLSSFFIGLSYCINSYATAPTVTQTKTKISQIEHHIQALEETLHGAENKEDQLNHTLLTTEKKLHANEKRLTVLQQTLKEKNHVITNLEQQLNTLNNRLHTQQTTLAKHVRARYIMGSNQPLQWLLQHEKKTHVQQSLTLYRYVIASDQHLLHEINTIQHSVSTQETQLQKELQEQQRILEKLQQEQQQLARDKQHHHTLLTSLHSTIQQDKHALANYQRDKASLTRLLVTLAQQSTIQTKRPFSHMRKKLVYPIPIKRNAITRMNQGIIFNASEGTPIAAVYPGKIVFSDFLKGYGLLVIIDHGWGFMTLYANNKTLYKHRGETVTQGETIASVGHTGRLKQTGLYFEIRQRGKVVPPLEWLA